MKLRLTRPNQLVIAIFLFFAMVGSAMAANQIGTIAALVGKVSIEREGKVLKVEAGAPVFENDKIITAGKSRAQVLLLDQTAVNVGQKAELVLDQFVFGGEDDKVALKVTKGTFRFISGKVATKTPDKVNVETPVAVIGVRGTEFVGSVGEDATVALLDGRIEVANDVSSQTIALPGFGVTVDSTSGSISAPVKIPQAELEAFLNATSTDRDTLDGEESDPETEGEGSDEEGDGGSDDEGGQGPEEEGDTGSVDQPPPPP
ncbi:MAG: FecR domain-containing protein, partial [Betaproteobacteria bacterium]